MTTSSKPKLTYVMKKVTLGKNNLNTFVSDEKQRRMIRDGKVTSLVSALKNGKHFAAPFVSNKIGNAERLVDGNHRYEAIKRVIAINPNFKIEVWVARHDDLTPAEERAVFSLWNVGTKQSADDFLKIYWDTIPFGKEMLRKLDASIYSNNKIKIKNIAGNHLEAKRQGSFVGGYSKSSNKAVADFQGIDRDDIRVMDAYKTDMEEIFGPYDKDYGFWKGTAQSAFYRIWYDNKSHIPRAYFIDTFKKVFLATSTSRTWLEQSKSSGAEASKLFYRLSLQALNDKSTARNPYVWKTSLTSNEVPN